MDELDKKSEKGLEYFKEKGSIGEVKSSLDSKIDGLIDEEAEDPKLSSDPIVKKSNLKWLWIVVAVFALSAIGYKGFKDGGSTKEVKVAPKVLFAQYFEPMEDLTISINRGESQLESNDLSGMELYNNKEYEKAASVLLENDDALSQVYGAFSLLNAGQTLKAQKLMESLLQSEESSKYHDILNWYYALTMIKSNDIDKAKVQLESISQAKGFKSKEAKQLLDQLIN